MLPSRRVTEKVSTTTRIKGALAMLVLIAMLVGFVIFLTWPARPRTWVGWAIALFVGGPLLVLGEYAGGVLRRRAPADPGRRVSVKRIGWLLAVLLVLGCLAYVILLVQARVLGDPLGALGRLIAPHYH
jgi:hypothetical protein